MSRECWLAVAMTGGVADSRVMSRDLPGESDGRTTDDDGACNAGCDLISLVRPKFSSKHLPARDRRNWETESRILVAVAPSRRKNSIKRATNESPKGGRVTSPVEWAGGRL